MKKILLANTHFLTLAKILVVSRNSTGNVDWRLRSEEFCKKRVLRNFAKFTENITGTIQITSVNCFHIFRNSLSLLALNIPQLFLPWERDRNNVLMYNKDKKTSQWVVRLIFFLGYHYIHFFIPPIQVLCLGYDYWIWNTLETLKIKLLLLAKHGRNTNWFGLFQVHNYLKWGDFCDYKWKFKIQKVEWKFYSAEKKANLNFQSEKDSSCLFVLLSINAPLPERTLYGRSLTFFLTLFLYPRNLDIIRSRCLRFFFLLCCPEKNSQLGH